MKSDFRPTSPQDAPAIAAFLRAVFNISGEHPLLSPKNMAWKYWADHPYWTGSRGYILERNGAIIAHGSVVPQVCMLGDARYRILHLIDWGASPEAPGAGVSLLRRVLQHSDAGYAVGGSDMTQQVLPAMGFRDIGRATRFVRPLRVFQPPAEGTPAGWRTVARLGRRCLWKLQAPPARVPGWTASPCAAKDISAFTWPRPAPLPGTIVFERSPELIAYWLKSPIASFDFHAVQRNGAIAGYFILVSTPGQVRIVDCCVDSRKPEDLRSLYLVAVSHALAVPQAAEVVTMVSDDPSRTALIAAGFHSRGQDPIRLYSRREELRSATAFHFQMLDNDMAYLHGGGTEFWA